MVIFLLLEVLTKRSGEEYGFVFFCLYKVHFFFNKHFIDIRNITHIVSNISTMLAKTNETNDKLSGKVAFLMYTELVLILSFETNTTPMTEHLGCHPRNNGFATH